MHTTLNEIRKYDPCTSGWKKLLSHLGKTNSDNEPLPFTTILISNGIRDAIWCLRVLPDYDLKVMEFKLRCARRVEHLDKSGSARTCLDVVEKFIKGEAAAACCKSAAAAAAAATYAYAAYAYADAADAAAAYAAAAAAAAAAYAAAAAAAAADAADAYDAVAYAYAAAAYAADAAAAVAYAYAAADAARKDQLKFLIRILGGK